MLCTAPFNLQAHTFYDMVCNCRQALLKLKAGQAAHPDTTAIYSKPAQPIILNQTIEQCVVVFPIYILDGSSKAYTNAFVQVSAAQLVQSV